MHRALRHTLFLFSIKNTETKTALTTNKTDKATRINNNIVMRNATFCRAKDGILRCETWHIRMQKGTYWKNEERCLDK